MEYLKKILGINVVYKTTVPINLPNYMYSRYVVDLISLDGLEAFFLSPRTKTEPAATLKKHIARVEETTGRRGVLILPSMTTRQKQHLIRERIPFVVEGKQIYLPFMGVYLQNRDSAERPFRKEILPSAQMLLLYFIYQGAVPLSASQAAKDLDLTPTSISRASRQLEEMGLLQTRKKGVSKILFSEETPEDLFQKARNQLVNPVKRTVYVPKEYIGPEQIKSSYSALSDYSMLSAPPLSYYASGNISHWKNISENSLQDPKTEAAVELWRYDPQKLSNGKAVDVLSLALSLQEDPDERVQDALEEMLDGLWRKLEHDRQ